jgi:threonine/homoserine/homoserine lactone efflux protein
LGISVHVFYTLIGVGALIHACDRLMMITQVCGAMYIAYLGTQLVRTQPRQALSETQEQPLTACARQALTKGFLTNATNPKATLFFLAIFTTMVSVQTPLWVQVAYGAWMCVINALWFVFVAFFFSNQTIRAQFLRLGHWFERLMGVVLLGFAVKLLLGVAFE